MTIIIAVFVIGLACVEGPMRTEGLAADNEPRAINLGQASGAPPRADKRPPEAATTQPLEKAPSSQGEDQKPLPQQKREPAKPFEPTEKVKPDQAIDFPADI